MNDDFIERGVAIETALELLPESDLMDFVESALMDIPAADVQPVKRAHWYYDPDGIDWNLGAWKCDNCHCRNDNIPSNTEKTYPLRWSGSKYCPNCGAKMEE